MVNFPPVHLEMVYVAYLSLIYSTPMEIFHYPVKTVHLPYPKCTYPCQTLLTYSLHMVIGRAVFGQLFEKLQWQPSNALVKSVYIYIYVGVFTYVQEDMYICMYIIVKANVCVYTCVYLDVSKCE